MICIGRFDGLDEGTYRIYETDGGSFIVARVGGELRAIENECGHMPRRVDGATLRDGMLTCPHHGTTYELTSGRVLDKRGFYVIDMLKLVRCEVRNGDLYIEPPP